MTENTIEATLNPNAAIQSLMNIINKTGQSIILGLQLIDSNKEDLQITSEDNFFSIAFEDPAEVVDLDIKKNNLKLWLLQKGFEDLIKAVNASLIEAYYFTSLANKQNDIKTFKALQIEVSELRNVALKLHLPALLDKIRPNLVQPLTYEKEIISLNRLRNCFVHRNGIVSEKDITDKDSTSLKVEYIRFKIFYTENGIDKELQPGTVISGENNVLLKTVNDSLEFNLGDVVNINYQQFKHFVTTCSIFGVDLSEKILNKTPA